MGNAFEAAVKTIGLIVIVLPMPIHAMLGSSNAYVDMRVCRVPTWVFSVGFYVSTISTGLAVVYMIFNVDMHLNDPYLLILFMPCSLLHAAASTSWPWVYNRKGPIRATCVAVFDQLSTMAMFAAGLSATLQTEMVPYAFLCTMVPVLGWSSFVVCCNMIDVLSDLEYSMFRERFLEDTRHIDLDSMDSTSDVRSLGSLRYSICENDEKVKTGEAVDAAVSSA